MRSTSLISRPAASPARTAIGAHQLILGARVEMECWAAAG